MGVRLPGGHVTAASRAVAEGRPGDGVPHG
jgi:hypothetical protein